MLLQKVGCGPVRCAADQVGEIARICDPKVIEVCAINRRRIHTKRAARVDFTGVVVPAENLLDSAKATPALRDVRLLGAVLVAAEATGSTAACLDVIVDYLKTRKQFGQYIGSYQALKHPTVDILCETDSARSLIYHAATLVEEGVLDEDAETACRMAKAQAGDALAFAGDRAVQFYGGMGFTYECDAQLFIRRGRWIGQLFGDAGHHRSRLLGHAAA